MTDDNNWKRGFGSMDPAEQRRIASLGGKAAHRRGTAHEWTVETARAAGRKGGLASRGGRGKLKPEENPAEPVSGSERNNGELTGAD